MTTFVMYAVFCWDCGKKWSSSLGLAMKPCPFCGSENIKRKAKR